MPAHRLTSKKTEAHSGGVNAIPSLIKFGDGGDEVKGYLLYTGPLLGYGDVLWLNLGIFSVSARVTVEGCA